MIRHAVAEDRRPELPDDHRALTDDGRRRFGGVVRGLDRLGVRFDRVLHSPRRRAVETAELLAPLLDGETQVTPRLAAEPTDALLAELAGERVAVVGHEPWLGRLVAWLVVGDARRGDRFVIRKGGVVALSGEPRPGRMDLLGVWRPKLLRRVR